MLNEYTFTLLSSASSWVSSCSPLNFFQWICHRSIRDPRQSDSTQDNLVIVALRWWSTLSLSFTKCIRLLSCVFFFAMVTKALRELKEMNTGDGNQSSTLKGMCLWKSLLLQISVWLHNWSCRCNTSAKTYWNHSYSCPMRPNAGYAHNHITPTNPLLFFLLLFFFFIYRYF